MKASWLAAIVLIGASRAGAQTAALPDNGYELLRTLQQEMASGVELTNGYYARGFIFGIADSAAANSDMCVPSDGAKWTDILVVVRAFLEQNTDLLSYSPGVLIRAALVKAYPCKG